MQKSARTLFQYACIQHSNVEAAMPCRMFIERLLLAFHVADVTPDAHRMAARRVDALSLHVLTL